MADVALFAHLGVSQNPLSGGIRIPKLLALAIEYDGVTGTNKTSTILYGSKKAESHKMI